jgi:hypothetical protein
MNGVPPTDELLRPVLERLRAQNGLVSFVDLVDDVYDFLGPPPNDRAMLDNCVRVRVDEALKFLAWKEVGAVESSG